MRGTIAKRIRAEARRATPGTQEVMLCGGITTRLRQLKSRRYDKERRRHVDKIETATGDIYRGTLVRLGYPATVRALKRMWKAGEVR